MSNIKLTGKNPFDISNLSEVNAEKLTNALTVLNAKSWTTLQKRIREVEEQGKVIKDVKDVLKEATLSIRDVTDTTFKTKPLSDGTTFQINKDTVKYTVDIKPEDMTDDFINTYAIKSSAVEEFNLSALKQWLIDSGRQDIIEAFTKIKYTDWDIDLLLKDKPKMVKSEIKVGAFKINHGAKDKE